MQRHFRSPLAPVRSNATIHNVIFIYVRGNHTHQPNKHTHNLRGRRSASFHDCIAQRNPAFISCGHSCCNHATTKGIHRVQRRNSCNIPPHVKVLRVKREKTTESSKFTLTNFFALCQTSLAKYLQLCPYTWTTHRMVYIRDCRSHSVLGLAVPERYFLLFKQIAKL